MSRDRVSDEMTISSALSDNNARPLGSIRYFLALATPCCLCAQEDREGERHREAVEMLNVPFTPAGTAGPGTDEQHGRAGRAQAQQHGAVLHQGPTGQLLGFSGDGGASPDGPQRRGRHQNPHVSD